jgi:aspartate/methionine/tyrosine aminotransferase
MEKTKDNFFNNIIHVLRDTAEICYNEISDIKCLTCPHKPEASMFIMVRQQKEKNEKKVQDAPFLVSTQTGNVLNKSTFLVGKAQSVISGGYQ